MGYYWRETIGLPIFTNLFWLNVTPNRELGSAASALSSSTYPEKVIVVSPSVVVGQKFIQVSPPRPRGNTHTGGRYPEVEVNDVRQEIS